MSMTKGESIRIMIADDHPVVREGLVASLNRVPDMTVVCEAATGQEALDLFSRHVPDVALVDLRMPEMDGVEAIEAICERFGNARIIILTTFEGDEDIYRALRAGARAYLLKDTRLEDLIHCIRIVHDGKNYIPPMIGAKLAERMKGPELSSSRVGSLATHGGRKEQQRNRQRAIRQRRHRERPCEPHSRQTRRQWPYGSRAHRAETRIGSLRIGRTAECFIIRIRSKCPSRD